MNAPNEKLKIQRFIPTSPERLFRAWTNADELEQWWGPAGVTCRSASIDLRVGGSYRIENVLHDGSTLWITGEFELVEAPRKLIYSWSIDGEEANPERVTVLFDRVSEGTSITIIHERIRTVDLCEQHQDGWIGCLDGLRSYVVSG